MFLTISLVSRGLYKKTTIWCRAFCLLSLCIPLNRNDAFCLTRKLHYYGNLKVILCYFFGNTFTNDFDGLRQLFSGNN